jgi:tetratricopeptide (TPR) repeat protein
MESNELPESDASVEESVAETTAAAVPPAQQGPHGWFGLVLSVIRLGFQSMLRFLVSIPRLPMRLFRWGMANKIIVATIFAGVIAMLLPVGAYYRYQEALREKELGAPVKAEQIFEALDAGNYEEVKTLAKRMARQTTPKSKDAGVAPFALGAVAVFEAEQTKGKNRQPQFLVASRYFEQANAIGFPEKYRAEGFFLYGKSLFEIGEFEKCRGMLLQAMKLAPTHKTEIYTLLANAYLNDSKPKLAEAMAQNTLYLADKTLSPDARYDGLLQRARIQLRIDKLDECRATLKEIPENSKESTAGMIIAGQISMREAEQLRDKSGAVPESDQEQFRAKYQEAIKTLREAGSKAGQGSEELRQAMYLVGVSYMEIGDNRAATDQFTRLHKLYPNTIEGAAANLQEGELERRMGHDLEMLSAYRRTLGGLSKSVPYFNPWISPTTLKTRLMNAYQEYQGKGQYEICAQIVGLLKTILPADQWRLMQADMYMKWGLSLADNAEKMPRGKRETMQRVAREQFRRAGQSYVALAQIYLDKREYTEEIWNAATAYLQGHNYDRAASLLKDYMNNEVTKRRPQALDHLGEALLNLGKYEEGLEALRECIDLYPRDAATCHARLLAARTACEMGDVPLAEKMLLANLNGDYLTPDGKEWRESLFLLGEILHEAGRYADAARRLSEAVERYRDLPETTEARYLLADSCFRIAVAAEDELKKDLAGSSRAAQSKIIQENYGKALEQYQIVREKLSGVRDLNELTPLEKTMLRNSIFSIGDVLYAMGDYEAAIKAYRVATNRYQDRPEVLDAYVQLYNAHRKLDQLSDAHNALLQAQLLLERMRPEVSFADTSIYSREQWRERLKEMVGRG